LRILVTGAAGFIGSHLSASLVEEGHDVIGIDNFNDYYARDLKTQRVKSLIRDKLEIKTVELNDYQRINRLVKTFQPSAVIHLAAQAGVRIPKENYSSYVDSNLVGFTNISLSVLANEVPNLVYASSSSVYGRMAKIPYSESEINISPLSFYGVTKFANELMAERIFRDSATRARGLRFFTVYGPWGRPDMSYFRIANSALNGEPFNLFGDGSIKRDFTFVSDVVENTKLLLTELSLRPAGHSDVVNIGGGNPVSITDLISTVEGITGKKIEINYGSQSKIDLTETMSSTKKINALLGERNFTHIEEGMEKFIEWCNDKQILRNLTNWTRSVL
jgi:UDP-glucuronate 4-epimerase